MNLQNARNDLQIENMKKIAKEGFCPFCPEHLKKYHKPPIVKTGQYWIVTPNMYPYENIKYQFLYIPLEHLTNSKDLRPEMWTELQELIDWTLKEYDIAGGTFLMRSGDMEKTGGTVLHLHAQFIVGSDPQKPVITRVG